MDRFCRRCCYLAAWILFVLLNNNICSAAKSHHHHHDEDDVEQGGQNNMEDQEDNSAAVENAAMEDQDDNSAAVENSVPEKHSKAVGDSVGIQIQFVPQNIRNKSDLLKFFNQETKTLDLSHWQIENSNEILKLLFYGTHGESDSPEGPLYNLLETGVVDKHVEILNLEGIGLTEIPLYLIAYALSNKWLRYVTLKHNNFNIPSFSTCSMPVEPETRSQTETRARRRSCDLSASSALQQFQALNMLEGRGTTQKGVIAHGMASAAAQFTNGILQEILPVAEQAWRTQHEGKDIQIFKTVVEIDERVPPITVVDPRILPLIRPGGWRAVLSQLCKHAVGVVGGMIVVAVPYAVTVLYQKYMGGGNGGDVSSSS